MTTDIFSPSWPWATSWTNFKDEIFKENSYLNYNLKKQMTTIVAAAYAEEQSVICFGRSPTSSLLLVIIK